MNHQVLLLPGAVLPRDLAYGALLDALGEGVDAVAKDLEVYATPEPPAGFGLATEVEGALREADASGFERFHIVGYSAGGAISAALAAAHPNRVRSLSLLEPAWLGNEGASAEEMRVYARIEAVGELPWDQQMPAFVREQLAPGVSPPPPPPGPAPEWMRQRPAGIAALTRAFREYHLDPAALGAFGGPVYFALGSLSNQDLYGGMAERAERLFADFTLDVFEGRHHFDPPHRIEPARLAERLRLVWERAT